MSGLLGVLVRATRAERVLEIGAGTGASGLEMAAALPPRGRLLTLEQDHAAGLQARAAFSAAGLDQRVTVLIGDAARYLHKIAGPFDFILQDSEPSQYSALHDKLVPLLCAGGLLVTRRLAAAGDYNKWLDADAPTHHGFSESR